MATSSPPSSSTDRLIDRISSVLQQRSSDESRKRPLSSPHKAEIGGADSSEEPVMSELTLDLIVRGAMAQQTEWPDSSAQPAAKIPRLASPLFCAHLFPERIPVPTEPAHSDTDGSSEHGGGTEESAGQVSPSLPRGSPVLSDVFCTVPGRLSLLNGNSKYKVTVAELQRRVSHPEALNSSTLGGVLRRAKAKNGGAVLRAELERIGLELPAGKRMPTRATLFTSLVEEEARHLASDFSTLCEYEFPHRELAAQLPREHAAEEERRERVRSARQLVHDFVALLVPPPAEATPSPQSPPLELFDLLTHGFGIPAVRAGLETFVRFLDACLDPTAAASSSHTAAPLTVKTALSLSPREPRTPRPKESPRPRIVKTEATASPAKPVVSSTTLASVTAPSPITQLAPPPLATPTPSSSAALTVGSLQMMQQLQQHMFAMAQLGMPVFPQMPMENKVDPSVLALLQAQLFKANNPDGSIVVDK